MTEAGFWAAQRMLLSKMTASCAARAAGVLLLAGFTAAGAPAEQPAPSPPLPEVHAFLEQVRRNLRSDEALLSQYTFTEKLLERQFDAQGAVTKTKTEVYEVYPSLERGHTYRKLIMRDGTPVSAKELAQQDHEQDAEIEKQARKLAAEGTGARAKREADEKRKEEEIAAEVFRVYNITLVDRELLDGRNTIQLRFDPRDDYRPGERTGKMLKKFKGRAWIDEADHQVARIETELVDTLSFGLGVVARLKPGARVFFARRKVNDEVWLPSEARFTGRARLFLIKALSIDALSQYSDYRKFSVGTDVEYSPEKPAQ
jgi:hypothetical protein